MNDEFTRMPRIGRVVSLLRVIAGIFFVCGLVAFIGSFTGGFLKEASAIVMANAWSISAALLLPALLLSLAALIELGNKHESNAYRSYDVLMDIHKSMEDQRRQLIEMGENIQLSDAARSIAHREREQAVLRQAINEDIIREDWEAAYYLVDQLERRFGYKLEAEQLRAQIDMSRTSLMDRKIDESIDLIKKSMDALQWSQARRRIEQLVKQHPDHPRARELPGELESRRGEHKRQLLKKWDQAVQRDDVDNGIRILKELDQYLTPSEAESLKEAARDVFRAKLHNLGVQLHLAVTEGQWERALQIGEQIISEFPNSRMANEVRGKHEALRTRAEKTRMADAAT